MLADDPIDAVAKDVKKMMRSGVRSLKRGIADELAEKRAEVKRLEKVVKEIHALSEDPNVEYPAQITITRTARSHDRGLVTKTETLEFENAKEAKKGAEKIERSLPKWDKLREQMLDDLKQRRKSLGELSENLSETVESWRGLLRDVLVTMP